ncbi:hypothetical protein [Luteirhabdus pelagi]|uniref:hypothetical protein n=1 Tax=Luteirhabdus pelagi TaxID=2792783 RepID=UPI00193AA416|nr:hypothetical protein [Luteirhabdus pelagi]
MKFNDIKQTIGFFAISIAWAAMNFANAIYIAIVDGKATDSGVIIFWSGIFILVSWIIFLIWPIAKIKSDSKLLKTKLFIPLAIIYAAIAYAVIIGSMFQSFELLLIFLPQALFVGLIFGIVFIGLINSKRIADFLYKKPLTKTLFFFSPVILISLFLYIIPMIAPSLVFRFVPNPVRTKIIANTIPKYKVGDDVEQLKNELPGYLAHIKNGSGNMFATMENFAFVLQANCGKIVRLEYSENHLDFDNTIYGSISEKPCP